MRGLFLRLVGALLLAGWPALAAAQPQPITATTITATSPSPSALCVGCPLGTGSSAPNSGARLATITFDPYPVPTDPANKLYSVGGALNWNGAQLATGSTIVGTPGTIGLFTGVAAMGNSLLTQAGSVVTLAGTFAATGFGTHPFETSGTGANTVSIRNTAAGATNEAVVALGNDVAGARLRLEQLSSAYTPTGRYLADGALIDATGAGGLTLAASNVTGDIRFYSNGLAEVAVLNGAQFRPSTAGGLTLGDTVRSFSNAYVQILSFPWAASNTTVRPGAGAPAGACAAGSLYLRSDGGPTTTLYVCSATNVWTAK